MGKKKLLNMSKKGGNKRTPQNIERRFWRRVVLKLLEQDLYRLHMQEELEYFYATRKNPYLEANP